MWFSGSLLRYRKTNKPWPGPVSARVQGNDNDHYLRNFATSSLMLLISSMLNLLKNAFVLSRESESGCSQVRFVCC